METGLSDALAFEVALDRWKKDPLLTFRHTSQAQIELIRWIGEPEISEVYWRSGNSGGKTWGGAALGVALARGLKELDGVPLPRLGIPNVGWVLTQSYKQQVESSQKAYLSWLGDHPKDIAYVQGKTKGYIETIYVSTGLCKHGDAKSCQTCSKITFHCEESDSAIGGRIDWAHADEPPKEEIWREVRARRTAGKRFVRFITATPLEAVRWRWLEDEFRGCLVYASRNVAGKEVTGSPYNGKAEIRSTLFDNQALTEQDVKGFIQDFANDPFSAARLRGDYVDASGSCPFDVQKLDRMRTHCRPPKDQKPFTIQTEIETDFGRRKTQIAVFMEIWYPPEPGEKYLSIWDPSSGVEGKNHDPAEGVIVSRFQPRLCARFNGYLAPYGLGYLAAIVGNWYNRALTDVETNSNWAGPFLSAMHDMSYGKINKHVDPDKPGRQDERLGFRTSLSHRMTMIGALQRAISQDEIEIPSVAVIDCLRSIVLTIHDKTGQEKFQAQKGRHDESLITMGQAAFLLQTRPLRPVAQTAIQRLGIRKPRIKPPRLLWK